MVLCDLFQTNASLRPWLIGFILVFALTNGVLYALLLPLWEGFDESSHYGYVQEISVRNHIPSPSNSSLSEEIWESLLLAPVSHVVQHTIPELRTFESYFALTSIERHTLRKQLQDISPQERSNYPIVRPIYEAHHAPAAYLLLSIPDKLLSGFPLLVRVRALRIISITLSILLMASGAIALCSHFKVLSPLREFVLLLTFSSQMFYATAAHISNDWLAVPLVTWLLVAAIRWYLKPCFRSAAFFTITLALGLLTKAYFLAFTPLFLGANLAALWHRRTTPRLVASSLLLLALVAGPWYVRNVRVNGGLSGTLEEAGGVGVSRVYDATTSVPWLPSIGYMARASLWTGNNQFNTFSARTLNTILFLLAISGCYYVACLYKRGFSFADAIVLNAIALFVLAIAYNTVVTFVATEGASHGASPWYMQGLLVPILTLLACGLAAGGYPARILASVQVLLWTYVAIATYVVKLVPQYGGYNLARIHLSDLATWYLKSAIERNDILSTTALAPPSVLYGLIFLVCGFGVALGVIVCRMLLMGQMVETTARHER